MKKEKEVKKLIKTQMHSDPLTQVRNACNLHFQEWKRNDVEECKHNVVLQKVGLLVGLAVLVFAIVAVI